MAGSKGGGGGGKGGSFTPPANQYGGGYGTGYYNPQPRLPQAPYNPMMDVYGSKQNVMQPMMGYYNQFPAAGSNYRPYQPQPQPDPPVYEPTPMPGPGDGPRGGQGGQTGFPIGSQPNTDFNNYNMNDISNAVNRSQFGDFYPVYRDEPQTNSYLNNPYYANHGAAQRSNIDMDNPFSSRDRSVENQGYAFTGDLSSLTSQMSGGRSGNARGDIYRGGNQEPPMYSTTEAVSPELAAPVYVGDRAPRPDYYPVSQPAPQMPILDAADNQINKGNTSGPRFGYIKYSQPEPQIAPIADPGFGGYDQNARAMMYGAPSIMFGGFR